MMFLCVHGVGRRWCLLKLVADVAALLEAESLDLDFLISQARKHGGLRILLLGLHLAHSLLDAEVPPELASLAKQDAGVLSLAAAATHAIADPRPRPRVVAEWLFALGTMTRLSHRVRFVADTVFCPTENDWDFVRLSKSLVPL
jgi:hypothetical protein